MKNLYKTIGEVECDVCSGEGKYWEESTCSSGAGYALCDNCGQTGKVLASVTLSETEVKALLIKYKENNKIK